MALFTKGGGGAGGKVYLDGEPVKELEMTSYKGSNPLAVDEEGLEISANTLVKEALQITSDVKKEGHHVWMKSEYGGISIKALTGDTSILRLTVSAQLGDLRAVDETFFDGWIIVPLKQGGLTFQLFGDGTCKVTTTSNSSSTVTWTYDPASQLITINRSFNSPNSYTWVCSPVLPSTFVVDENSEKYPDGEEKDGNWFDKSGRVVSYEGYYKSSSTTKTISITNPFGKAEKVKMAIIFARSGQNSTYVRYIYKNCITNHEVGVSGWYDTHEADGKMMITITDSKITFTTTAGSGFEGGVAIMWEVLGVE